MLEGRPLRRGRGKERPGDQLLLMLELARIPPMAPERTCRESG